jgi:hypothetical protein
VQPTRDDKAGTSDPALVLQVERHANRSGGRKGTACLLQQFPGIGPDPASRETRIVCRARELVVRFDSGGPFHARNITFAAGSRGNSFRPGKGPKEKGPDLRAGGRMGCELKELKEL